MVMQCTGRQYLWRPLDLSGRLHSNGVGTLLFVFAIKREAR